MLWTTARRASGRLDHEQQRPGWIEVGCAAVTYVLVLRVLGRHVVGQVGADDLVTAGLANYGFAALAGITAFATAAVVRIRRPAAFGVRSVRLRWLGVGAGFGALAFVLGGAASTLYVVLSGDARNVQLSFDAAADGGPVALLGSLLLGSVASPVGEELAFRGVLANALGRYGGWVAVLGSAAVFALAHGINPVLPVAFVIGVVCALLLRRTGSVWPGVCVHLVNNALATLGPLVLAALVRR